MWSFDLLFHQNGARRSVYLKRMSFFQTTTHKCIVSNRLRAHWTRLRLQGDQRVLTNYRQQKCWKY